MSLYMFPAIVGLILKVYILLIARKHTQKSDTFFGLILMFSAQNLCEIFLFLHFYSFTNADYIMRAYYCSTFWVIAYMSCYALEVSKVNIAEYFKKSVFAFTVIVSGLIFFSDLIVAGYKPIEYAVTALKGANYWVFQFSVILAISFTALILVIGYIKSKSHTVQIQCAYTLSALLPLLVAGLLIVSLMAMGFKVNAMTLLPIASTLFLLITLISETKHNVTDIRRFIPGSIENKIHNEVLSIFPKFSAEEINYKEALTELEKLLVSYKYQKTGGNVSETAKSMDMPRPTLYSIFKRLDIMVKEKHFLD